MKLLQIHRIQHLQRLRPSSIINHTYPLPPQVTTMPMYVENIDIYLLIYLIKRRLSFRETLTYTEAEHIEAK